MLGMTSENCDLAAVDGDLNLQRNPDTDNPPEKIRGNSMSTEGTCPFNVNQKSYSDQEHTRPIKQKIVDLSAKIQSLKKEQMVLYDQVKCITSDSFPDPEVFNKIQCLGTKYELLQKKYLEESSVCELLKKKYLEESSERKRLYNEVIELKGNIRVFCRCRPLNQAEIASGSTSVIEFDPSQENVLQIVCSDTSRKQFKFDHVFGPDDTQDTVFAQTKPIVTSVLDGYNVCIFAYGQTGTGKTFTMEGTPENRGVNHRTLEELFWIVREREGIMKYELFVSMLEVYNEKIRDLLAENANQPTKKLEIKQAAEGAQEIPGLVESPVSSTDEVLELLKSGSQARSVGATIANELSSRSHCLLRVTVKGENLINGQRTRSRLWLVDLAGSERVGRIEVEGERLKESQFINKSLSALGDVISALASKTPHVPYRNSKLTHMLQSSLGGDCKTLMFVQISPSAGDLGESLCSLNFASRVRGVEHGPARKHADYNELLKYKQLAEKLKQDEKETKKLQENLQSVQLRLASREHTCRSLQEKVRDLENQLAEERRMRLKEDTRAFAAASAQSSLKQAPQEVSVPRKPPLAPSKLRLPLRRISNRMPLASPVRYRKTRTAAPPIKNGKENFPKPALAPTTIKDIMKPRRMSVAMGPPPPTTKQVFQPKRRVSIATLRPEPNSYMTPLRTSDCQNKNSGALGRLSSMKGPRKVRYSKLFTPLPDLTAVAETTPMPSGSSSSKFMGSPPNAIGSWRPKHPTVLALQKKTVVWSPPKTRGTNNYRKSFTLPSAS